jgi:hypothetical protein
LDPYAFTDIAATITEGTQMSKTTSEITDNAIEPVDKGTGFLFWGWILVTLLNLGMVSVSLAVFAP